MSTRAGKVCTMSNLDTVNAYFAAMRTKDASAHRALFTDDAEVVNWLGTFVGIDAIAEFYRDSAFTVEDLWPEPGTPIVAGDLVAVELRARVNGDWTHVADFFTLREGKIARLVMYQR
jgi:ketosteroid isomerase-like protein